MDTRASPEDAGEKERPWWIDAPTATSSSLSENKCAKR